ncbi:carbonic anhydrase [Bacteroidota bacterium]
MDRLITIKSTNHISPKYRQTPIGQFLKYHNLNQSFHTYDNPQLLIGTCVDNRVHLRIPGNFAYMVRAGGANMRYNEFKISYAIAFGKVKHIALIGHNHCGMSNLEARKDQFVEGLIETAGWNREQAEQHFAQDYPYSEIGNEIDFILNESKRLKTLYPKIQIAPMMYLVEDKQLYFIQEK